MGKMTETYGYGSIPMKIPFLVGWTSINPSYFGVHQGYKVLTHCHIGNMGKNGKSTYVQLNAATFRHFFVLDPLSDLNGTLNVPQRWMYISTGNNRWNMLNIVKIVNLDLFAEGFTMDEHLYLSGLYIIPSGYLT
jgi:hypothetical protein